MEARSGRVTLNTQNGGSYAQVRVILIDVAICTGIVRTSACVDTYFIEEITHQGSGAGAETELDPATCVEPRVDGAAAPSRGHRTGTSSRVEWEVTRLAFRPKASSE